MTDAAAISDTSSATEARAAAAAAVRCLRCDYDLRGLPDSGRCPECGVPVWRSLVATTELRAAPPGWLAGLTWGAGLVLAAMLGYAAAILLAPQVSRWPFFQFNLSTLQSLVLVIGTWLLTRPQRRFGPTGHFRRWLVRVVALCLLASQLSAHLTIYTGNMRYIAAASWFALPVALLPLLLLRHAQRLAQRVPRPALARHLGIAGVGFTTSVLLAAGVGLAGDYHWFRRGREPDAMIACAALIVLFYLWTVVALAWLTLALRVAKRDSRSAWQPVEAS